MDEEFNETTVNKGLPVTTPEHEITKNADSEQKEQRSLQTTAVESGLKDSPVISTQEQTTQNANYDQTKNSSTTINAPENSDYSNNLPSSPKNTDKESNNGEQITLAMQSGEINLPPKSINIARSTNNGILHQNTNNELTARLRNDNSSSATGSNSKNLFIFFLFIYTFFNFLNLTF